MPVRCVKRQSYARVCGVGRVLQRAASLAVDCGNRHFGCFAEYSRFDPDDPGNGKDLRRQDARRVHHQDVRVMDSSLVR